MTMRLQHLVDDFDMQGRQMSNRRGTMKLHRNVCAAEILDMTAQLQQRGLETYMRNGVVRFVAQFDIGTRWCDEIIAQFPHIVQRILCDGRMQRDVDTFDDMVAIKAILARPPQAESQQQQEQQPIAALVDEPDVTAVFVTAERMTTRNTFEAVANEINADVVSSTECSALVRFREGRSINNIFIRERPIHIGKQLRANGILFCLAAHPLRKVRQPNGGAIRN
jgi:hypothetical protein